ncbi:Alcohol dehydrogenase GroES-like domain [Rhizoctonia solani]|uniref:Alcohol dehydrogenase GroES-like domain n=1 Tax=Rhizoctonia solani TaxID=456999 RepID=A0A8H7ICP8_9AGAM|nr:Alcohol dehydrogenase GroES-like domain [Rhizoctonia solani]
MIQQHNASILPQKHGKLEVGTRPTPTPQGTQALVKYETEVNDFQVNSIDWKAVDYGVFIENFPAILGFDGAGVIHAVGPNVTNFMTGDRVFFQGGFRADYASYQEYALVETDIIAKIPDNINDDQASTVPVCAFTAYLGLFERTGITAPLNGSTAIEKPVLILGGSSSVGQFAIQLARIAGFSPIVTTASSQHAELLKSLGATHVFDRDADVQTIRSAFRTPINLAVDTISNDPTQSLAFDILTTPSPVLGARLNIVTPQTDTLKEKNKGDVIVVEQVYGSSEMFKDMSVPFWKKVGRWIEGGELVPNRVQLVDGGLAGIPEALSLSRKGVSGVKLVVHPQM